MRPFPIRLLNIEITQGHLLNWAWKTPVRIPENREICIMPSINIIRYADTINNNIDFFEAVDKF